MRKALISIAMGFMCLVVTSGCAAWTDKSKNKDSLWKTMQFWKKPYQKPAKVAAIWTHDILTMTGKPATRGFGGRLYFYNEKSQAISVDGELVVHGYEEQRVGQYLTTENKEADKTFKFTAEQFTEHFSPSDLGASYSVWIPWDAADGMQKEITLIPTFVDKKGAVLQGEPAKLVLPGRKVEEPLAQTVMQNVSFQQSQTPTNMGPLPNQSGLRTTTISMPSQVNRQGRDATTNNTGYNANSNSVVVRDVYSNAASNMMYAGTPEASRAQAMYKALAIQSQPNGFVQPASLPMHGTAQQPATFYPSNMPNMLPSQLPQSRQFTLQNTGTQNTGRQNTAVPNQGVPNMPVPNVPMPNMQIPAGQATTPQQNVINPINPGVASAFSPLPPGAVQAAFASTQQVPSQWQPFAQGASVSGGQVQQATYNAGHSTPNLGIVPAPLYQR